MSLSSRCSVRRRDRSTLEPAVEEKTVGLFVPQEEEEGTIGDEMYNCSSHSNCRNTLESNGSSTRFSARLVHVDVGLMVDFVQPESSAAS